MERRSTIAIILVAIITGGLLIVALFQNGGDSSNGGNIQLAGSALSEHLEDRESQISSMRICGNSTDIVYPELMDAKIVPLSSGEWQVTATFVDDSAGYDAIETYDKTFNANLSEVLSINTALYDDLSMTYASNDTYHDIGYFNMGFSLEIKYRDGSWIYLLTILDAKGHLVLKSGTGSINRNLLDGFILEPGNALDGLVDAIHSVFQYHLE